MDRHLTLQDLEDFREREFRRLVNATLVNQNNCNNIQRELANARATQARQAAEIRNLRLMIQNQPHRTADELFARMRSNQYPGPQMVPYAQMLQQVPQAMPQPVIQRVHQPGVQPIPQRAPQPIPQRAAQPALQPVLQPDPRPDPQPDLQPNIQARARAGIPERNNNKAKRATGISKKRRQGNNVRGSPRQDRFVVGSVRQQRDTTFQPEEPVDVRNLVQRKNPGRSSRLTRSYFPTPTPFPEG